jgi:hypothetical protein
MTKARQRWSPNEAWKWYRGHGRICGCNFVPSTAINPIEMWQEQTWDPVTIERELGWAAGIGMNSVRVYLHLLVWKHQREGFFGRVDRFLKMAARHGIFTMFVLFDDCWRQDVVPGKQPDPIPGVHNSGWVCCPGHAAAEDPARWDELREYAQDVIARLAHDERVLIWDLYNEPGNSMAGEDNAKGHRREATLPLLRKLFGWARGVGPSQPLTVAAWGMSLDETETETNRFALRASDVNSFHSYSPAGHTAQVIDYCANYGRPLLCSEFMARTKGSRFQTHLPLFAQRNVGCYCWGLVSGKTQTIWPWRSPKGSPEPNYWFHDVLRPDGSAYDPDEVRAIRAFSGR